MKKLLEKLFLEGLVLALFMPMVIVAAAANPEPAAVHALSYQDDFTKATMDERIVLLGDSVYDSTAGVIKSEGTANDSGARIFLNRDRTPIVGTIVMEYTLKSSVNTWKSGSSMILSQAEGGGTLIDVRWYESGGDENAPKVTVVQGEANGAYYNLTRGEETVKYTIQYNTISGLFSLWINDCNVADGKKPRTVGNSLSYITIFGNLGVPYEIEDFKWYYGVSNTAPAVKTELFAEDFEDADLCGAFTFNEGHYAIEKGNLTTTNVSDGAVAWGTTFDEVITGEYITEVILSNATGGYQRLNLSRPGTDVFLIYYSGNTVGYRRFFGDIVNESQLDAAEYNAAKSLKVTVYYNSETGQQILYFNDILVCDYIYPEEARANVALSGLHMCQYGNPSTISVGDIRVYRPVPVERTDDEKIAIALDRLEDDQIFPAPLTESGYLADDITLPKTGAEGCTIEWSASPAGVIDLETGYVTRQQAEQAVTLTATISSGSGTPKTKNFAFKVPALGASPDGLPAVLTVGRRENFDAFDEKTMSFRDGEVGSVKIENGKLNISSSAVSASAVWANIYLTEQHDEISGEFALEFIMKKAAASDGLQIQFGNASDNYLGDLRYHAANVAFGTDWNEERGRFTRSEVFETDEFGTATTCKVTLVFDTDTGLVNLLINNRLALENHQIKPGAISYVTMIRDNMVFKTAVDNFRFFYVKTDDIRAARQDAADLTYDKLFAAREVTKGVIAYGTSLPTVGNRGSVISWHSSHPEIIAPDGTVTRPEHDTDVMLTATVTSGAETQTAVLKVTVLRVGEGDLVILKKDLEAITLESLLTGSLIGVDLITDDLKLYTDGKYGSAISWQSSNPSVIAANGKVTRPTDENNDIYSVLTATVTNGDYSLTKEFRLGVLPTSYSFDDMPLPERYKDVYKATFSVHTEGEPCNTEEVESSLTSYRVDTWSSSRGWCGKITEYDGYVEMCRLEEMATPDNAGKLTGFNYPLQPSTQGISDLAVTQYSLTKIGSGEISQEIFGSRGTLTLMYWQKNGTIKIRHRDANAQAVDTYTKAYEGKIDITFMSNSKTGTISLWINGESIFYDSYPYSVGAHSLRQVSTFIGGKNYITAHISEFDTYTAYPITHQRPEQDKAWLTEELLRDGVPAPAVGKLSSNLNLVTKGQYGSTISWASTDADLIATDGTVTRPQDWPNEREVTLTATISYSYFSMEKEFTFSVMPLYSADESVTEKDSDYLTAENWNFFSFGGTDFSAVTTSLDLPAQGPYGSTYIWKSSNSKVITPSGRVIRPRWDGNDETVTLTATIIYGSSVKTKQFTFTVLADEMLTDPQHMSDEDFFGVWDGSNWTTVGKLNYSYGRKLGKVEAAAKAGDYKLAKEEFLNYMKNRSISFLASGFKRNPVYADAFVVTGIHNSENHNHYAAMRTITSHDYASYEIPLTGGFIAGAQMTYKVAARYNEDSTVRVISMEHPNAALRPRIEVTVNGTRRTFGPAGDTTIRGGQYSYNNYSDEIEMPVRYFGEFQGDGLSDLLLRFDLSALASTDVISDPQLILTAKLEEPYAQEKELVICREGTEWDASTVTMNSMTEYTFNFNGVPGENTWRRISNAESEYIIQTTRMSNQGIAAAEYAFTGDEKYAYAAIWDLMDNIIDTQGRFVFSEEIKAGNAVPSVDWEWLPNEVRYGAYPSALTLGVKMSSYINMFDILVQSRYMTPDACTAIIKNLWHGANELEKYTSSPMAAEMGANQNILEANAYAKAAMYMPEFLTTENWVYSAVYVMENLMKNSFFADGAYMESTDGYTGQALGDFISFWDAIRKGGYDYSPEAKELLRKGVLYHASLRSNGGVSIVWGDNGKSSTRIRFSNQDYYNIAGDEEIQFVSTYGRKGTMPDWTSSQYESTMLAIMRSDWTDEGVYAMVPSSGWGTHGHADGNQIILNGYQRAFLIDGGYFSYTDSPERRYLTSTLGHNTVEVDSTSQRLISGSKLSTITLRPQATKHDWVSNSEYDFYSVTTHSNVVQKVDHRRTITFLKPNILIVSDLMSPKEEDALHSYKQLWHMSALARLSSNAQQRTIFSNFESGAQLKIASADTDAVIREADGYDTEHWGIASIARYGYYHKENVSGKQTFDTVLMPYKGRGDVLAEHIVVNDNPDLPQNDVTAMKITTTQNGDVNYMYYMLDYDHEPGAVHSFGGYETDGALAVIRTAENGDILEVVLNNGSYIKKADGTNVLASSKTAASLSYEKTGDSIQVFAADDVAASDVALSAKGNVKTLLYNKKAVEFKNENSAITMTGAEIDSSEKNDPGNNKGGIWEEVGTGGGNSGNTGGGTGGGNSGNTGGGNTGGSTGGGTVQTQKFGDTSGHWAEKSIERMAQKGIVTGENGYFRPDDSVTRAELITMAVRALGLQAKEKEIGFADVSSDSWYAPYVQAALENGLISADSLFRPNDLVTREEMAKILSGAKAALRGETFTKPAGELSFGDAHHISEWAKAYVLYASQNGLMNGMENNEFAPKLSGTRAQVAAVLDRMLNK